MNARTHHSHGSAARNAPSTNAEPPSPTTKSTGPASRFPRSRCEMKCTQNQMCTPCATALNTRSRMQPQKARSPLSAAGRPHVMEAIVQPRNRNATCNRVPVTWVVE
eukprot:731946-Prymnesium_polylepis.2